MRSVRLVAIPLVLSLTIAGCSVNPGPKKTSARPSQGKVKGVKEEAPQTFAAKPKKPKPLRIAESGYTIDGDGFVHYGVVIRNPRTCQCPRSIREAAWVWPDWRAAVNVLAKSTSQ